MALNRNYFTVGELSDLTGVSRQAIRYYDKIGLLKPGKVDGGNAYRYYEPMHVLYLNTIMRLSQLGCSLKEIKRYISGGDMADIQSMLEFRKNLTQKKIAELENALNALSMQIDLIGQGVSAKDREGVFIKDLPSRRFIYTEYAVQPSLKQGILQINRMVRQMEEAGMLFVCSPVFETWKGQETFKTGFFYDGVPEPQLFPMDNVPEGRYACAYHRGMYDSIPDTIGKLCRYIRENSLTAQSNFYQLYLIDFALTQDEDELLTELQVRVG
jgi:DNA-binding transcriptional MerR regulator